MGMTSSKYSLASEMFKFSPFHYCTRMRARTHTHKYIYTVHILHFYFSNADEGLFFNIRLCLDYAKMQSRGIYIS